MYVLRSAEMTVDIKREALPLRRRKWLAFLDCGADAELPLLPPPRSTATSSASDIPRAFVEQYDRCDTDNEVCMFDVPGICDAAAQRMRLGRCML